MPPTTPQAPQSGLDPDAVNLTKAIRQEESGGNATEEGKSGEYGAYQWEPATWDSMSKASGVDVPLKQATLQQQNQVAYNQVKQWKDQGYNIGQIASMWNAGAGDPNAYLEDHKGTNAEGVSYDTPTYAKNVATYYQQYKNQGASNSSSQSGGYAAPQVPGQSSQGSSAVPGYAPPTPPTPPANNSSSSSSQPGLLQKIASFEPDVATEAAKAGTRTILGLGGMGLGIENTLNKAAGFPQVGGIFNPASQQGAAAQQIAKRSPGIAGIVGTGIEGGAELAAGGGEDLLKPAAGLLDAATGKASQKAIGDIAGTVAPKLTAKQSAEALATRGATKSGLLGNIGINPDPYVQKIAKSVQDLVPDFNPKASYAENINATKAALNTEAENLKSQVVAKGQNIIYPFKELAAQMDAVPKDLTLQSDPKMSRLFDLTKNKALEIAQQKGGTISSLLDARKSFDALVDKEIPNLYDKEYSPMRTAVSSMRNVMNNFIADKLPDVGLKDSLTKQSHLFSAIDNMAAKAASGPEKEVGTNVINRTVGLIKKHPIVTGLGAYEAADTVKKALHL